MLKSLLRQLAYATGILDHPSPLPPGPHDARDVQSVANRYRAVGNARMAMAYDHLAIVARHQEAADRLLNND